MLLSEKICIVTGAASPRGIGRATARTFAQNGSRTIILDIDESQAKSAAADIGEGHRGLVCDVTDKGACLAAVDWIVREFGRLNVAAAYSGGRTTAPPRAASSGSPRPWPGSSGRTSSA